MESPNPKSLTTGRTDVEYLTDEDQDYLRYSTTKLKESQERVTQLKPIFDGAVEAMKKVEGGLDTFWSYLQMKYNLQEQDSIDMNNSGVIKRAVNSEPDKNRID